MVSSSDAGSGESPAGQSLALPGISPCVIASRIDRGTIARCLVMPPDDIVAFRFPDGSHYVMGEPKTPEVGDTLRTNGQEWLVVRVAKNNNGSSITVTLRPLEGQSDSATTSTH